MKLVTFQLEDPDEMAQKTAEEMDEKQQRWEDVLKCRKGQQKEMAQKRAQEMDEKQQRWEDVLKRRKGQQKEKGQRAEKIARESKKEKVPCSSNHRKVQA